MGMFLFRRVIRSAGHCEQQLEFEPASREGEGLKTLLGYRIFWRKFYCVPPVEIVPF